MLPTIVNGVAVNRGRLINLVDGINGVASPGTAQINMPVNRRIHDMALQCTAVNYTGGTALALGGTLDIIDEMIPSTRSLLYSLHVDDLVAIKNHLIFALDYIQAIEDAASKQPDDEQGGTKRDDEREG